MDAKTLATEVAPIIIQLPDNISKITLIPPLIAAGIAFLAIIINIYLNHKTLKKQFKRDDQSRKHEIVFAEKKLLIEKYEEFIFDIYEFRIWYDEKFIFLSNQAHPDGYTFNMHLKTSPFVNIKKLIFIYFSEFESRFNVIEKELEITWNLVLDANEKSKNSSPEIYKESVFVLHKKFKEDSQLIDKLLNLVLAESNKYRYISIIDESRS